MNTSTLSINVSINIDKIIAIDENNGYFKTKLTLVQTWVDKLLTYQNLKRKPSHNVLSNEDMDNIWTPVMVFENIEHEGAVKLTKKQDRIMIIPCPEFTFQIQKHDDHRNTRFLSSANKVSPGPTCQFLSVCLVVWLSVFPVFFFCLNDQAHFA